MAIATPVTTMYTIVSTGNPPTALGLVVGVHSIVVLHFSSIASLSFTNASIMSWCVVFMLLSISSIFSTSIPFLKNIELNLGWFYIPFVILVITGTTNAVNLTDGLDGLAIGLTGLCFVAFTGLTYVAGRTDFSSYLQIAYIPGAGELAIYCGAAVGAALGFLWFNSHPASVFMGDTGALALGGALGAIAILIKKELLLVIVGGVFVIEVLSVIIQVLSYRYRGGKRVFKMAPIHHHFELSGWPEPKVVVRFWIIGALFALLTLSRA